MKKTWTVPVVCLCFIALAALTDTFCARMWSSHFAEWLQNNFTWATIAQRIPKFF